MSMINTILNKEKITINSNLNILWTECSDTNFKKFIEHLGHKLVSFSEVYYGCMQPHILLCNNKVQFFEQCKIFSIQYHLPVLLIDHNVRSHLLDVNKINQLNNFPCVHSVAISQKISESWNNSHDQVLSYNIENEENKKVWQNLIYQTAKLMFMM